MPYILFFLMMFFPAMAHADCTAPSAKAGTWEYFAPPDSVFKFCNGTNWVSTAPDNLGSHSATQNVKMNEFWLSGDGGNEGMRINENGVVSMTATGTTNLALDVNRGISFEGGRGRLNYYNTAPYNQIELGVPSTYPDISLSLYTNSVSRLNITPSGNVGIGTVTPAYRLQVEGQVAGIGAFVSTSDARLKKNIAPIPYGLETVLALKPVSFEWKEQDQAWKKGRSLGLIAQDIEPIVPEVVSIATDTQGTKSIAYSDLVPILIKAIQEQQRSIEALEKRR